MKKKALALSCIAAIVGAVGCSNGGTDETKGGAAPAEPAKLAPKTLKMLLVNHPIWAYNKNWPVYKYMEDATKISFNVEARPGADYDNALNLAVASGDLPDILFLTRIEQANQFGQQGAFVNIFEHLGSMPNYNKFLTDHPDVKESIISADGKSYILPNYGLGEQFRRVWLYREDIFKKHGLKLPTTYDELYETAKKLKQLYPQSYPVNAFEKLSLITNTATNFGTWDKTYYDHDSKSWKYGPTEDSFKTMLEYYHKLYAEGLIPPDFISLQRNQSRDLFAQDKAFLTADFIGIIDEYKAALKDKPDFELAYMPPVAGGPKGVQQNPYTAFQTSGFAIASTSKNVADAIRYFDWMYSPEGIKTVSWGKEGETYTVENGKNKFKADFADFGDLRVKTGMVTNGSYTAMDFNAYLSMASPKLNEGFTQVKKYETKPQPRPAFNAAETEIMATMGQSISKHYEENVTKFIMGARKLEEWDQYVAEVKKLGLDKVLEAYKTAYERVQKTK